MISDEVVGAVLVGLVVFVAWQLGVLGVVLAVLAWVWGMAPMPMTVLYAAAACGLAACFVYPSYQPGVVWADVVIRNPRLSGRRRCPARSGTTRSRLSAPAPVRAGSGGGVMWRRKTADELATTTLADRWRQTCEGAGACREVTNGAGVAVTITPPVVGFDMAGAVRLTVRLLPGMLPADLTSVSRRLAEGMGVASVRVVPAGTGYVTVTLLLEDPLTLTTTVVPRLVPPWTRSPWVSVRTASRSPSIWAGARIWSGRARPGPARASARTGFSRSSHTPRTSR